MLQDTKQHLLELILEGIISLKLNLEDVKNPNPSIYKLDKEDISEMILEAYREGYIKTFDGKLDESAFTSKNLKMFVLDIEKLMQDEVLKFYSKYEDLQDWYAQSKDQIFRQSQIALFLSHLESKNYFLESREILAAEEKIKSFVCETSTHYPLYSLFNSWYQRILDILSTLPSEFDYAKPYFKFNHYIKLAKLYDSNIFSHMGRNELCPCGSLEKFKKCCMI